MNRHVARVCRILPFQNEMMSVSKSFSLSGAARSGDLLEEVQGTRSTQETIHGIAECLGRKLRLSTLLQWTYTLDSCNFSQRLRLSSDCIATLHAHGDVPVFLA